MDIIAEGDSEVAWRVQGSWRFFFVPISLALIACLLRDSRFSVVGEAVDVHWLFVANG